MVYEYTKARAPIAAMYNSPGPCYGLPALTGQTSHDPRSSHTKTPAYSFGVRHGKFWDDCSPGPCYYPDPKICRAGKDGTPHYSLYSRNKDGTMFRTPGPGSYQPEHSGPSASYNHPSHSFGSRPRYRRCDNVPAANSYSLPEMTGSTVQSGKRQAPKFSLSGRQRVGGFSEDLAKAPGPGTYSTTDPSTFKSKAPLYSMTCRNTMPGDHTQKPGPGAHSPQDTWAHKNKKPEYSFGIRHTKCDLSLAPMDGECSVDDGLVPNMTSCQDFLICLQGRVRRRVRCASGLMFDASIAMCNYENVVNCGFRPKTGSMKCYTANVNVTIKAENLAIQPIFLIETKIQAPRQPLYNFLLMAAGKDKRFSFQTRKVDNYGEFVSSINGLEGREEEYSGWVPSDERNNQISKGIHEIFPEDGEFITFKFYSFAGNLSALKNLPGLASQLNRK